jgi:hypothetical protein
MTSKIKVDNISDQNDNNIINESGDVITVGAAGDTVAVAGNIIKSNALQASDGGVIISQSGTTITVGASGDTVSLASGASQSGFGRSGTVNWQTSSIKTATFTAANGEGYFADTSSGAFTMNLPAGTAGNIVSVVDYTNTFQTNNLTIQPNGSQKIGGVAAPQALSTEGQSVTFVYVDDTEGWKNVQDSTSNVTGNPFLIASGGTETTSGDCKIHVFTGPGTFTVASASQTAPHNVVSYQVVAGGGGGGGLGGGGGGGGYREYKAPHQSYSPVSAQDGNPGGTAVTVTAQAYPITVGGGGSGTSYNSSCSASGSNSIFSTVTSAGGGGGGSGQHFQDGEDGGSGGGGNGGYAGGFGCGNTPPVSPPQGSRGGNASQPGPPYMGGGGGGTVSSGSHAPSSAGGAGGAGTNSAISGSTINFGGGGGGGANPASTPNQGAGSSCGTGGAGGASPGPTADAAGDNASGANQAGGGGGSGGGGQSGGNGASGKVVIRYKFK